MRLFFLNLASPVEQPTLYTLYIKSPLIGHNSHHVRTLMITFPLKVAMQYPHFPFFLFFGGGVEFLFCAPCHTKGGPICNPILDIMH